MFLYFLCVAVCLVGTHASGYQCPTPSQMLPCKCQDSYFGLAVICESGLVDQIRGPLEVIGKTEQRVFLLILKNVGLWNLPSNVLVGPDVHLINIKECYISTVDEDAFADVADKLEWLFITGNPLEEVPSHALQKLSNLWYLFLENNRIQVLRAGAFKGLDALLELHLNGNRIKFIEDNAFVGIGRRFRELHLCHNELTSFPGKQLNNLTSLRYLEMADNKIASLVPEDFDALGDNSLVYLNLENNTIRHLPANIFTSLKKMTSLDLSGNGIESIHPSVFEGNKDTLMLLKLRSNGLQEIPVASLKNLSRLDSIDLRYNSICNVRKDDFAPHGKTLESILLSNNLLKIVDPEAFVHLDNLKELSLQSNQLMSAPFATYSPVLDTLEMFDIDDNPLHCDCNLFWLSDWINGTGSSIVLMADETKCASPEGQTGKLLVEVPPDELLCDNSTPKLPEPCCNCGTEAREGLYNNSSFSQLGFTSLLTALGISRLSK